VKIIGALLFLFYSAPSEHCQVGITDEKTKKEKWYIAKPLKSGSILSKLMKVYSAWLVLTGKSFAVHYKEDEKKGQ
jgi:hypothetical protein